MSVASAPPPASPSPSARITRAEYMALPEGPPHYELIDGKLVEMARPLIPHIYLNDYLTEELGPYARKVLKGRFVTEPDLYLPDMEDVFEPDHLFLTQEQVQYARGRGVFTTPEMVCEVLSPSTERKDRTVKLRAYGQAGVRHVWLIQPRKPLTIQELVLEDTGEYRLHATTVAPTVWTPLLFPDWSLDLGEAEFVMAEPSEADENPSPA
jgi:Uma2 family endonuclease